MRALTWQGTETSRSPRCPTPGSRSPPTPSSRSRRPPSAARTCTCTGCSARTSSRATCWATRPWASWRRSARGSGTSRSGDRVVVPFNISCGYCWMCSRGLFAQCETTQVRAQGKGAALFGYTSLYGSVPGGQAQYLRVPQAQFGPVKVPHGPAGRAVPVPVRHPAHRLAGRRLRRHPGGRDAGRARPRPGRPARDADRAATWASSGSSAWTGYPSAARPPAPSASRPSIPTSWTTSRLP